MLQASGECSVLEFVAAAAPCATDNEAPYHAALFVNACSRTQLKRPTPREATRESWRLYNV